MAYKLFIDDERDPVTDDWVVARHSYAAMMVIYIYGIPNEIAFDHDLGGEDTSRSFIKWLADYMYDTNQKFPVGFKFSVHSQNPIGAAWIRSYMNDLISIYGQD